jgi:dGTPase
LTHSLEVSSVARDLAGQAARKLDDVPIEQVGQIAVIAATCGLMHDLGNPPFGHAGELAISTWFHQKAGSDFFASLGGEDSQLSQDFLRFEGNAQTLRLVSKLQLLSDEYSLDLTCGTLSAAMKYTAPSNYQPNSSSPHEKVKPGYFSSEADVIEVVRQLTGTGEMRNPISFLVEAADDIVYCSVDLEDSIRKGVLKWSVVESAIEEAAKGLGKLNVPKNALERAFRLTDRSLRGQARDETLAQTFRTAAIGEMVPSAIETFIARYPLIMNGEYHQELVRDEICTAAPLIAVCKGLLKANTYRTEGILRLEVMGRKVIHDLMDVLWEAAHGFNGSPTSRTYPGKIYFLMSENYRRVFEKRFANSATNTLDSTNQSYVRLQLVTDQIAGMTDAYACSLHKQLTNS